MKRNLTGLIVLAVTAAMMLCFAQDAGAAGACTCARFNDWRDMGCLKTPGRTGEPSVNDPCSTCQSLSQNPQHGMPQWWVDEPYINLHITDVPLSYKLASGKELDFRFYYMQRYRIPDADQCPNFYYVNNRAVGDVYVNNRGAYGLTNAAWGHNWMVDIMFWDVQWEDPNSPVTAVFKGGYEALVFNPEGGINYFCTNWLGATFGASTGIQDPQSQVKLLPLGTLGYPVVTHPLSDTNGIFWGNPTNGFQLVYPNGSKDIFSLAYFYSGSYPPGRADPQSTAHAFLTQRIDAQGRITSLGYELKTNTLPDPKGFRVRYVVDPDGRTNTFLYQTNPVQHAGWQLQEIDDPYGRKAQFGYGSSNGRLTYIIDAAGNSNSFAYQTIESTNTWISSMTTPYGTTSFNYFDVWDTSVADGFTNRTICVSEPGGAHQLFCYLHQCSVTNQATAPTVPGQAFDDGTESGNHTLLWYRNTFHWDRRQFDNMSSTAQSYFAAGYLDVGINYLTTEDLKVAYMSHWLWQTDAISISPMVSSQRDPSPDTQGQIEGPRTWFNYPNQPSSEVEGDAQINCIARLLPDGTNQFTLYKYHPPLSFPPYLIGLLDYNVETYSKAGGSIGYRTNSFSYATNSVDLLAITNSPGQWVKFSYNTNHQATGITNALNQVTTFAYNGATHNMTNVSLPNGQTIALAYTTFEPPHGTWDFIGTVTIQPQGRVINIPDYTNGLPRIVDATGTGLSDLWFTNTWDGLNRRTSTQFPDGTTISNIYNRLDLGATKDRLGNWTYFGHDALQNLTSITNALNFVTTLSWCDCGALTSIIDPLTNATSFFYNNQGLLTNVLFPDTSQLTYSYDSIGRLTSAADGLNRTVSATYNNQGLPVTVNYSFGQVLNVLYDSLDRPSTITDANGVTTTNQYDLISQLIARTWQDGIGEGFAYATNGLIAYTNRNHQVTRFARDNASRLIAGTNANLEVTQFGYNALDETTSLIDGLNHTTAWNYNQFGWLTNKVDALNREIMRYTYNPNGQLTNRWMLGSSDTVYAYDAVGNLTNIAYPGTGTAPISMAYDALNRLTTMIDAVGTNKFTYTALGQLKSETGPWTNSTLNYLYSQQLRTSMTLTQSSGTWVQNYGYDSAWRLQTLTSPAGSFDYGFNGASPLVRTIDLPNTAWITNHFDSLAQLDFTALINASGNILDGYSYIHDLLGLRTNVTRNFGLMSSSVTAGYDKIAQLTSWTANEVGGAPRLNEQLGYAYDAADNLRYRTNNALVQTFTTDPVNELTNVTRAGSLTVSGAMPGPVASVTVNGLTAQSNADFTFASSNNFTLNNGSNGFTIVAQNVHGVFITNNLAVNLPATNALLLDLNGNLTNDGTRSFSFDAENRLTNVTVAGAWKSDFVFDGFGRRRIIRDFGWQGGAWVQTNETRYVFDGLLVIQERDTNNNALVTYTRGLDFSDSLQGAGGIGGLLARTDPNGSTFYHSDGAGNITGLMDGNQYMVARYLYDPFGKPLGQWGPLASINTMGFSSQPRHKSGLILYPFRAYEPNLQRWPNRDPIGEAGGINLYQYVGNNPINRIDPYGLAWYDGIAGLTGLGGPGTFSAAWSGFGGSWSDSANSIGQALGGAAAGNWDQVANAYDSGVFGQTQDADPFTYYGTRAAVGTAAAVTAVASAALASEGLAASGCYRVGATVARRAASPFLRNTGSRWFSQMQTDALLQTGRLGNYEGGTPLLNWLTTFRYAQPGGGEVVYNWLTGTIIHANPFF